MKIISGGQNGADVAALKASKSLGIETGGCMPLGFKTLDGNRPEYEKEFGVHEHKYDNYASRTYDNVKNSDGTIRFMFDADSAGEKCTLKAIVQYSKPYFDVHLNDPNVFSVDQNCHPTSAIEWIKSNNIKVLNVAGNSERTCPGIEKFVFRYMVALLTALK